MNTHKIGIDIGSTTAKIVVLSHDGDVIYSRYERHQAAVYPLIYLSRRGIRSYGRYSLHNFHHRKRGNGSGRTLRVAVCTRSCRSHKIRNGTIPFHTLDNRYRRRRRQSRFSPQRSPGRLAHERELCGRNRRIHRSDGCITRYFRR